MAYTCLVEKQSAQRISRNIYRIYALVTISDGADTVLEESITALYNKNAVDFSLVQAALEKKVQNIWDRFKEEDQIYRSNMLDSAINETQTNCNEYINS